MCACARMYWRVVQENARVNLLTVSVGVQKRLRRASDLVRTGSETTGPGARGRIHGREKHERETREASSRAPRGRERANGVLGSSPGPSCNLHSSRNRSHRRPDERMNGRTEYISGSGEREGSRIQRRRTRGPCYFMAAAGS